MLEGSWALSKLELEFGNVGFWGGENWSIRRKTSRSREENQQQTQPTYDAGSGNQTRDTLVGGERSHHCAIPAPHMIYMCNSNVTGKWIKVIIMNIICLSGRWSVVMVSVMLARGALCYHSASLLPATETETETIQEGVTWVRKKWHSKRAIKHKLSASNYATEQKYKNTLCHNSLVECAENTATEATWHTNSMHALRHILNL